MGKVTNDSDTEILDIGEFEKNEKGGVKEHHDKQRTTSLVNTPPISIPIKEVGLQKVPESRAPLTRPRRLRQPPPRYHDFTAKILNPELQDYHKSQ